MKMIIINDWSLLNKLKTSMLIGPSVGDLQVYLAWVYIACSPGRLNRFYYRLGEFGIYGFLNGGGRLLQ